MSDSRRNWNSLRPLRRDRPQTPSEGKFFFRRDVITPLSIGDGFALTGGEGRPEPKSVYYSAPIACSENPTQLAFDYWIYANAELRVRIVLDTSCETNETFAGTRAREGLLQDTVGSATQHVHPTES